MRKSEKPGAPQRRIWRMTPEAPQGEFVDFDDKAARPDRLDKADKPVEPPGPDELREASWVRSSWDLMNGLEVTESSPGDLDEAMFGRPANAPQVAPPVRERAQNAGEWIRRFALRLAELDLKRDPRELIELAKRQWMTLHYLPPEEAAEMEHGRPAAR